MAGGEWGCRAGLGFQPGSSALPKGGGGADGGGRRARGYVISNPQGQQKSGSAQILRPSQGKEVALVTRPMSVAELAGGKVGGVEGGRGH